MSISTFAGSVSGAFIATLSCPFELVKVQKQLEYLLQTSSISTGATVIHIQPQNEMIKPTIINKTTVGAGLPVTPTSIPPIIVKNQNHQRKQPYASTSSWSSAREILKRKGLTGLYSGFSLHLSKG
jgi:solute carrier family 25 carnitine/acylcarnitine transporter 20/29